MTRNELTDTFVQRQRDLLARMRNDPGLPKGHDAHVDKALRKIDAGEYGVCEECAVPIGEPRLRAAPYTRLCTPCKARQTGNLTRQPRVSIVVKKP